jgi:excisionase family DNA binding protein
MNDTPDLITTTEAAKLLDVSTRFIRRQLAAGRFPEPYRMGERKIRHSRRAVLAWLEGTRQHSASQSGA